MKTNSTKIEYRLSQAAHDTNVNAELFGSIINQIPEKNKRVSKIRSPYFILALSQVVTVSLLFMAFYITNTPSSIIQTDSIDQAFMDLDKELVAFETAIDEEDKNLAVLYTGN